MPILSLSLSFNRNYERNKFLHSTRVKYYLARLETDPQGVVGRAAILMR